MKGLQCGVTMTTHRRGVDRSVGGLLGGDGGGGAGQAVVLRPQRARTAHPLRALLAGHRLRKRQAKSQSRGRLNPKALYKRIGDTTS